MTKRMIALTMLAIPLALTGANRFTPVVHAQPAVAAAAATGDDDRDRDAREAGHRDGAQAAMEDMRDHRRADADAHDRYRHPPVGKHDRDAYRAGFRDGYNDAMRQSNGVREEHRDYDPR